MPPQSALPPPSSSQPTTPFQPHSDPSSSPSISNNPPPQPPPGSSIPSYASLNSAPYTSSGPSSYSQHIPNSQYMYQQQHLGYYPQQPPRHLQPNVSYNPSNAQYSNRYPEQQHYPQQSHYQPMFQQHSYGNYPGIPTGGGGGPGPATLQNGYGGVAYHPESYQHIPYGIYPQQHHYPMPTETYQPFSHPAQPNGHGDEVDPPRQPPQAGFSLDQGMNGQRLPNNQSFHPTYPPNHPYAYGVGVGYPGYHQHPQQGSYSGLNAYQEGGYIPPSGSQNGNATRNFSKSLNPAAAGFSFTPASGTGSRANSQPSSTPILNGESSSATSQSYPRTPSTELASETPQLDISKSNGHISAVKENTPEPQGDTSGTPQAEEAQSDLILIHPDVEEPQTIETPSSITAPSSKPNISATTTTATESSAPTTASSPISAQTPKPLEGDRGLSISTKTNSEQSNWTFVGNSLAGLTSPDTAASSRRVSGPSGVSTSFGPNGKKRTSVSTVSVGPLRLVTARPDHTLETLNSYSAVLKTIIPDAVQIEVIQSADQKRLVRHSKGNEEAAKKKLIYAFGDDEKKRTSSPQPSADAKKLIFGQIDLSELAEVSPSVQTHSPNTSLTIKPSTPSSDTSTPAVRAKPASWAALVGGSSRTPSVSSSSKLPSPARSTASLPPTENEAGPSRLPSSEAVKSDEHASKPVPAPENKKVPFNYAAAAASGASMTPQEELAKLLSEGVKGKAKQNTQATLPRGLINTGNMCFANTILQVLVYCSPFTELFEALGQRLKADLARKTPLLEAMIIFLREFNAPYPAPSAPTPNGSNTSDSSTPKGKGKDPRREAFIPENVYDAMKENKRFDSMRRGHQEDAEEYLGFFLNTLHEELLYVLSRTQSNPRNVSRSGSTPNGDTENRIERPVSPGAGDDSGWLEVGKKQKTHVLRATESKESAITRLFGGTIRSLLKTPGNKDSVTIEPYQPLQLDIQSPAVKSLEDALKHLTEPEVVHGVWSAQRKAEVEATKQIFIETFPQVWILHLKRFVYDPKEYNVVKKNKAVAYGQELVVPPEIVSPGRRSAGSIKYRLFGVVYHHGVSASGGHYTVAVSRQDGGGWIHFDDENVTNIPKEDVIVSKEEAENGKIGLIGGREKTAYLLFYQRIR
ncbi:uncharacterized protein I206_100723 [Kwoniella pini CBS 10737]|uniref:ubiquitinyl hydrolase 1 n=1 Tax=Kwoniella pini CBS 10737 TaxID=1296096 RepID=A0A1B9ICU0_9TREE|nr:uncharacterized protein I206_00604 [Kwoniella pini CBS 10737]OCF53303.1 hypothetical protein I206_00604 [Kwoniella pini CBS 10737]